MSQAVALTDKSFSELVAGGTGAALVDFWAAWCGPCRMMAPVVDELAAEYADKALIAKLDVDAYGALAAQYGVMNIPTLLLFKDGREAGRFVGVQTAAALREAIDAQL